MDYYTNNNVQKGTKVAECDINNKSLQAHNLMNGKQAKAI